MAIAVPDGLLEPQELDRADETGKCGGPAVGQIAFGVIALFARTGVFHRFERTCGEEAGFPLFFASLRMPEAKPQRTMPGDKLVWILTKAKRWNNANAYSLFPLPHHLFIPHPQ